MNTTKSNMSKILTAAIVFLPFWGQGDDVKTVRTDALNAHVTTKLYLVVDLSGGKNVVSYPVSYLEKEPEGGWPEEYRMSKLVLRRINPGTFTMGSPEDEIGRFSNEMQHEVTISKPFYMGVFEVTRKQYDLVMSGEMLSTYKYGALPRGGVSWNDLRGDSTIYNWPSSKSVDASSFMGKLRAKTGLETFDLPTEAQWEYACRAGTKTALNSGKDLRKKGNDTNMAEVGRYSNNRGDGKGGSSDVAIGGSYLPNAWGLYDMHGNLWEWCLDVSVRYEAGAVTDPVGVASAKASRVLRGGCYNTFACFCRSAYRNSAPPSVSGMAGFRLCCSAESR